MATIIWLPEEVLGIILGYNDITFEDIISFRYVCKQFWQVAKGEKYCFLKKKFFQRWSTAKIYFDKQYKSYEQQKPEENVQKKRLNFIETGLDCVKELQNCISVGLRLNYNEAIFRMRSFLAEDLKKGTCKTDNNIKVLILMDEIQQLLIQPPRLSNVWACSVQGWGPASWKTLVVKYFLDICERLCCMGIHICKFFKRVDCKPMKRRCYKELFDYLSIYWCKNVLETFEKNEFFKKELLMEEYATILAQELQPGKKILYSKVNESLNTITLKTLDCLYKLHPQHSIFSLIDDNFLSYLENNNIDNSYWSEQEETQIMDALKYMFEELNFQPIDSEKFEYMCIDYVLENKRGNDAILLVILLSVTRRLGLV